MSSRVNEHLHNSMVERHAESIYNEHRQQVYRQTDRMFAILMAIQWVAGIVAALIISPRTWIGQSSEVHIHVWGAIFLGGVISFFPITLAVFHPGHWLTRYSIAVGQMLMSSLLIHLTGGRIETHFHIFGSLAFLSFYRDWRVLVPATLVVTIDHILRGIFYPQSVFGVLTSEHWRWVEHAGWVAFEDVFLVISCRRGQREMHKIADNTAQLDAKEARYRSVTDSASDAIITIDDQSTILFVNRAAEKISGYHSAELIGEKLFKLIPENLRSLDLAEMQHLTVISGDVPWRAVEIPIRHKDGHEFLVEISFGEYSSGDEKIITTVMRDITERKRAESNLRKSEEYRNLFKLANDAIIIFEPKTEVVLDINEYAGKMYGFSREEFIGRSLKERCQDEARGSRYVAELLDGKMLESFESVHYKNDGTPLNVLINSSVIEFEGKPAVLSIIRDITSRIEANAALRESEYKLRSLIENMSEGLLHLDLADNIVFTNKRFCEMTGYAEAELLGRNASELFLNEEGRQIVEKSNRRRLEGVSESFELQLKTQTGSWLWSLVGVVPAQDADGNIIGSMSVHTDITERKRTEAELLHTAMHDKLTGLPNRALFLEHLRRIMGRSAQRSKTFAVIFLDFDGFKLINDSLGHLEGDRFLIMIARRLEAVLRANDIVARLGGDEFTILLDELTAPEDALFVVERIQELFKESFTLSGRELYTSASIGIAFRDARYNAPDEMLRDADIAMYRAKTTGKARYEVFNQAMHEQVSNRLQLETEMRMALERHEFSVFYQPIVEITTNKLVGFEALTRWFHPQRGQIMPDEFIPIAEETGLIVPIGEWVLRESCRQVHDWQQRFEQHKNLSISVNLSCKQFMQPDLVERIGVILQQTKINPDSLRLEITESHMMENSHVTISVIKRLRELGVQLSIDDFGTGYSSLSYLHQLPINHLKIDRSFINLMNSGAENSEIVRAIIMLAKNLNLEVIAEGIETEAQVQQLTDLNCNFGQGYFFSPPTSASQTEIQLIQSHFPEISSAVASFDLGKVD